MNKALVFCTEKNECGSCAFFLTGSCVLEKRRPWNLRRCEDFKPYCLTCDYPDWLCHTCHERAHGRLKASRYWEPADFKRMRRLSPYVCVW